MSGKPLFVAPRGRSWESFVKESKAHGWPSFRDEEVCVHRLPGSFGGVEARLCVTPSHTASVPFPRQVVAENVRLLANGEAVSVDGTHLGHNLPDGRGNRYCINLVSIAGKPS